MRQRLPLAASSLLATFALLEAGLRVFGPSRHYFVLVPGTEWTIAEAAIRVYDDVHFTEAGSRRLAEVLTVHFKR
jgi:hypothetical protein